VYAKKIGTGKNPGKIAGRFFGPGGPYAQKAAQLRGTRSLLVNERSDLERQHAAKAINCYDFSDSWYEDHRSRGNLELNTVRHSTGS
jgi:hypothetical protein